MNLFKLFLVVLSVSTLLLSCKGPDCEVKCSGHKCSCESRPAEKEDSVDSPKEVTPTKLPWDVVPCDN